MAAEKSQEDSSQKTRTSKPGLFCILGPPAIEWQGRSPLKNQKAAALVAYLTIHGTVSRERLTGLLWPELPQQKASTNLRGVIHKLKTLAPDCLQTEGDQLKLSDQWQVDLGLLMRARAHRERRVVAQFKGMVCEGVQLPECEELEQWLAQLREDAACWSLNNALELSNQWLKSGHPEQAIEAARIAVGIAPHSEPAHAQLVKALIDSGDRSAAHRQYKILEDLLAEEFGSEPTEDTRALLASAATRNAVTHNLPASLTSFLGRQDEVRAIQESLRTHRMVTVTGMGGVGKTQLCLEVARIVLESEPPADGVWLVRLAPVLDSRFMKDAFEKSVGLKKNDGDLSESLRSSECILIVDNCEHLVEDCSSYLRVLLERCPHLKILATSREPLKLPGELILPLEPFALPQQDSELSELRDHPALRLLVERGRMACPHLELSEDNAQFLLMICRELDGLPLAIELAAARLGMLSPEQLAIRLSDRFHMLKGRPGDELRQQTLGALLDWSYETLPEELKELLADLSVFVGSFDLSAVEDICLPRESSWEALDRLTLLVEKSLVSTITQGRVRRYKLLETVKKYSRSYLSSEDKDRLWDAHLEYYLKIARRAEEGLLGKEQRRWVRRLDAEVPNMQAAVRRAQGRLHRIEGALELYLALQRYWMIRDFRTAIRTSLPPVLEEALNVGARPELVIRAYRLLGEFATDQGDLDEAEAYLTHSLQISEKLKNREQLANTLKSIGNLCYCRADLNEAREAHLRAYQLFEQMDDQAGLNGCLNNLGLIAFEQGDFEQCRSEFEASLALSQELQDHRSIAVSLTNLGHLELQQGAPLKAGERFEEALKLYKLLGEYWNPTLQALKGLAHCALDQRKSERCRKLLALAQNIANRTRITDIPSRRASLSQLKEQLAAKCPVVESFKSDFAQLSPEEMMEELGF